MKHREDLLKDSDRLKSALRSQVEEMKSKSAKYGKSALWIGGGVLTVFALSKIINGNEEDEEIEQGKIKKSKSSKKASKTRASNQSNFLLTSLQEQAILFSLGLLAERLRSFLKETNQKDDQDSTE